MMQIRDMLYVNSVERRLGRPLTEEEMDGDSRPIVFPGGRTEYIQVPILLFPYDLITNAEDLMRAEIEVLLNAA
jgi:hypothetical protein